MHGYISDYDDCRAKMESIKREFGLEDSQGDEQPSEVASDSSVSCLPSLSHLHYEYRMASLPTLSSIPILVGHR